MIPIRTQRVFLFCLISAYFLNMSSAQRYPNVGKFMYCLYSHEDVHQTMEEFDTTCQTALHHACDHSSWSWRICRACEAIARACPPGVINSWSTGYATYYTPLLYVCDAAGRYATQRCDIARVLIDRKAEMEVVDRLGNTPFLLAAAAGFLPMVMLLHAAGANIHAVNNDGAGARSRCKQSSGSTAAFLIKINVGSACRKYPSAVPRGNRKGPSQNVRQLRCDAFLKSQSA